MLLLSASAFAAGAQGRSAKLKPQWLRQVPAAVASDVQFVSIHSMDMVRRRILMKWAVWL